MPSKPIESLLAASVPKPAFLSQGNGAPAVALACHTLMVDAGFVNEPSTSGKYAPPAQWHGVYFDQWIFRYQKPGFANKFVLHCSLQSKTNRLLIHASEENNVNNVQLLGLQADNYVPDVSSLKSNSWQGILHNEERLVDFFEKHISGPLLAQAEPAPPGSSAAGSLASYVMPWANWSAAGGAGSGASPGLGAGSDGLKYAAGAALLAAAVAGGVLLLRSHRSK